MGTIVLFVLVVSGVCAVIGDLGMSQALSTLAITLIAIDRYILKR